MDEETRQTTNEPGEPGAPQEKTAQPAVRKKFLVVAGIVAAVLLLVMAAFYAVPDLWQSAEPSLQDSSEDGELQALAEDGTAEDSEGEGEGEGEEADAEMLPQTTRALEREGNAEVRDPFAGPILLNGLITGGEGGDLAIIETSQATYVVKEGERIDDYWTLKEIGHQKVVLEAGDERFNLSFDAKELMDTAEDEAEITEEDEPEERGEADEPGDNDETGDEAGIEEETNGEESAQ